MQVSDGGAWTAALHWAIPKYDWPIIPTLPVHQSWSAIHSIAS